MRRPSRRAKQGNSLPQHALRTAKMMEEYDVRHGNWAHAIALGRKRATYMVGDRRDVGNTYARVLGDFVDIHSLLELASRGKLSGKRIVQLGASTGVYCRFLQEHYHARAIPLDIDMNALVEGQGRGVRYGIQANAVPPSPSAKPRILSRIKELIGGPRRGHLPFQPGSIDYVISEHFLFSDYHHERNPPGFETKRHDMSASEENLANLNEILRKGGRLIITSMHPSDLKDLRKYRVRARIYGFVVERVTHSFLGAVTGREGPTNMILRKVQDWDAPTLQPQKPVSSSKTRARRRTR